MSRIILKNISYKIPDGTKIFENISFTFNSELNGLVGKNGIGKSTLAKIINHQIMPDDGSIDVIGKVIYQPQIIENISGETIIDQFSIKEKYAAMQRLENGKGDTNDLLILDDDWELKDRIEKVKRKMDISYIDLNRQYDTLSGGEKVRCIFAGILLDNPEFIILDEPTNHLDDEGRKIVYEFVADWKKGMIIISHDRNLLRLMNKIVELSSLGLKSYGGNYDFYLEQRKLEDGAIQDEIKNVNSELNKSVKSKNEVIQRQQKRNVSGEKKAVKSNMPKVMANLLKGSGEKTLKKLKDIHAEKVDNIELKLSEAKSRQRSNNNIKLDIEQPEQIKQSNLVTAENVNSSYSGNQMIWKNNISFSLYGGERVALNGKNGSGKTTLLKMILDELEPAEGSITVRAKKIGLLDQELTMLEGQLSILENIKAASEGKIPEHELRIRLGRFLFYKDEVFKKINVLSGGERMRAGLACLLSAYKVPELIILDEPTNNLDLESIEELTNGLNQYKGAILVVSHDKDFLKDIRVAETIDLDKHI